MSGLTTAILDDEARRCADPGWGLPGRQVVLALIAAARLQVAIDELPLPEGWELRIGLMLGEPYACAFSRTSGDEEQAAAPTMLATVLDLGDALRSRT